MAMKRRVWGPYQNIIRDDLNDIGTFTQEAVEMALAVITPPARLGGLQASAVGGNTVRVTAGWMVVHDSTVGRPRLGVLAGDTNLTVSGPAGTYLVVATVSEQDLETRTIAPPPQTLPNGQPNPFYDPTLNPYNQVTVKGWQVSLSLRPGSYTPANREAVVAQVTWNGSAITGVTQVLDWPKLIMADRSIPAIKIANDLAGNGTSRNASGGIQVNVDNSTVEISSNTLRVKDGGITTSKLADGAALKAYSGNIPFGGANWNSYKNPGMYRVTDSGSGGSGAPPATYRFGTLLVFNAAGGGITQVYYPHTYDTNIYFRQTWDGTDAQWTDWRSVPSSNNASTISGAWTFTSALTAPALQGNNNGTLLINGRNFGVDVRIDEDNSGENLFRVTQGPNGANTLLSLNSSGFLTASALQGNNNANLLINGRNHGVEVRIDEDNTGENLFRVTQGPNGANTLFSVDSIGLGVGGFDLKLGTADQTSRGNTGLSRALVKAFPSTLVINYAGDFSGGVRVEGPGMTVGGNLATAGNLTVSGNIGVGTTSPSEKLEVSGGSVKAQRFISTASTGTAPLQVSSTTLVGNLNSDLLDGYHASTTPSANTIPVLDSTGALNLPPSEIPVKVNGQPYTYRIFYVDQANGNDANTGTSASPFRTIAKAIQSVPHGGTGHIYVVGNYDFNEGRVYIDNKQIHLHLLGTLTVGWRTMFGYDELSGGFTLIGATLHIDISSERNGKLVINDRVTTNPIAPPGRAFVLSHGYAGVNTIFYDLWIFVDNYNPIYLGKDAYLGTNDTWGFIANFTVFKLQGHYGGTNRHVIVKDPSTSALMHFAWGGSGAYLVNYEGGIRDANGTSLDSSRLVAGVARDTNGLPLNVLSNRNITDGRTFVNKAGDNITGNLTVGGNLGVGTTSPAFKLDVSGDVRWTGTLQGGTVPWARLSGHPSVIASGGLTGGGSLSSSITLSVADGGVTTSKIADGAVTTAKLSDTGVIAGTYSKVTVDAKGRVISGTTLSSTDLPSHTHNAADITSGRLSLARLPTSSVANRVLLVGSANTDPVYGQITPDHLGTGWVPYSRIVGEVRTGLLILNPDVVMAWNVTSSHGVIDDTNRDWQVDPGGFGADGALSNSSIFRVPIPGHWNNVYDVHSVQVATALYNGTSPLNPPSPSGTAGTVLMVGNNSDVAYQVLGFEVVNNILWVWLKRVRFYAFDGYNTRAFIQVLGRNNGNPVDSRLVVTHRQVLSSDRPVLRVSTTGGTVALPYFIGFLHHIPSLHGTAARTVNISLVNAPSQVTLDTTSVNLISFNQLFYNSLNLNIPTLASGTYNFTVRFTYGTQTADIPVRLEIY